MLVFVFLLVRVLLFVLTFVSIVRLRATINRGTGRSPLQISVKRYPTHSRWTSSLPSCLWSLRIFPSLPGSRLTVFIAMQVQHSYTTRQPMVEFYLLTFPRFPLQKKEHKSYFGKNRTHNFRTSRCADYLLDHSGGEGLESTNRVTHFGESCFHPFLVVHSQLTSTRWTERIPVERS